MGQRREPAVMGQQGSARGQASAGAAAEDHDAIGIDAQLGCVTGSPHQTGITVVDRRRIRVLWGQPIFRGYHDGTNFHD